MIECLGSCGHPARPRSNCCQQCWDRDILRARLDAHQDFGPVFMVFVWVLPVTVVLVLIAVVIGMLGE